MSVKLSRARFFFAVSFWHMVFHPGGPAASPLARLRPLLLRDLPLEVGEGSWEWHHTHFRPVVVVTVHPFYPVGICLLFRNLGALDGFLVAGDTFVGRELPDLYGDAWPSPSQCRNVLPHLGSVLLPCAGFV